MKVQQRCRQNTFLRTKKTYTKFLKVQRWKYQYRSTAQDVRSCFAFTLHFTYGILIFPWEKILFTFRLQVKMNKGSESESSSPVESEDGSKHSGNSTKGQGWTQKADWRNLRQQRQSHWVDLSCFWNPREKRKYLFISSLYSQSHLNSFIFFISLNPPIPT